MFLVTSMEQTAGTAVSQFTIHLRTNNRWRKAWCDVCSLLHIVGTVREYIFSLSWFVLGLLLYTEREVILLGSVTTRQLLVLLVLTIQSDVFLMTVKFQ